MTYGTTYTDSQTREVWRYKDNQTQVDVQLVRDAKLKNAAQEFILTKGWQGLLKTKITAEMIWNVVFAAANGLHNRDGESYCDEKHIVQRNQERLSKVQYPM